MDERVVVDGTLVSAAGVTAGIEGALVVAAMLRGDEAAQAIQLYMQYAPVDAFQAITARREETARRVAARLGVVS